MGDSSGDLTLMVDEESKRERGGVCGACSGDREKLERVEHGWLLPGQEATDEADE